MAERDLAVCGVVQDAEAMHVIRHLQSLLGQSAWLLFIHRYESPVEHHPRWLWRSVSALRSATPNLLPAMSPVRLAQYFLVRSWQIRIAAQLDEPLGNR